MMGKVAKLLKNQVEIGGIWRLMALSFLVGVVAGLGAIAFYYMLSASEHFFFDYLAGYRPLGAGGEPSLFHETDTPFNRWLLLILPAIGGLISGVIVFWLAPEAEGHGTDAAIDAYLRKSGEIRARVPIIKAITAAITIGSGGSAGREGPIAQIGASFGSLLGRWLKLSSQERRVLLAAGMGAGVGAIFHAPLAGSLFAAEVLYRELDLEYEVILPAVLSSIVAYAVFAMQFGWDSLFIMPAMKFTAPSQLLAYLVLALAVSLGSLLYVRTFYGVRDAFKRLHIPNHFKPAIGGLVVGAIGFFIPQTLGAGYGIIQEGLTGKVAIGLFVMVALGKIVTTSFSIGSGGSGGVFGPAVVIGGAIGGAVGVGMDQLFPAMGIQPGSFVLVGMAGFFAAAANTPISTIIMVSEMTGNYYLLVPAMWVCFIAYALSKNWTIYEKQLSSRLQAPAHMGEMMEAILQGMRVQEVVSCFDGRPVPTVLENTGAQRLIELFAESEKTSLPLVNDENKLIGTVDGRDLRSITARLDLCPIIVASDLAQTPAIVKPGDSLIIAIREMTAKGFDEAIVVSPDDEGTILAILSRSEIVSAYYDVLGRKLAAHSHRTPDSSNS